MSRGTRHRVHHLVEPAGEGTERVTEGDVIPSGEQHLHRFVVPLHEGIETSVVFRDHVVQIRPE